MGGTQAEIAFVGEIVKASTRHRLLQSPFDIMHQLWFDSGCGSDFLRACFGLPASEGAAPLTLCASRVGVMWQVLHGLQAVQ